MIRRPPRSTRVRSSAASDVYKRQPIGACLAAGQATGTFKPGNHGSTFGGNPLACVAGMTTLSIVEQDQLLAHAEQLGQFIRRGLTAAVSYTHLTLPTILRV